VVARWKYIEGLMLVGISVKCCCFHPSADGAGDGGIDRPIFCAIFFFFFFKSLSGLCRNTVFLT
jgi:hypothetical protein